MIKKILSIAILSFGISQLMAQLTPADVGSEVKFKIKNFGFNTNGSFTGLTGTINFDPKNLTASNFNVSVNANSVNTGNNARDKHLRKEEYFDVEKYSTLNFTSTKVTNSTREGWLYMFGKITIKGVTKDVSFPFQAIEKEGGYLFTGEFKLNRRDFGVGGSSISLSDNLTVSLSIFAKK